VRTTISLRNKLLIFAVLIAVVPLIVAGRSMIRIAQDELKSSANSELVAVAEQLVSEINDRSGRTWLAPLAGLDPLAVLRSPAEAVQAAASAGEFYVGDATHVRGKDDWLATIVLPLRTRFAGASSALLARVDLDRTRRFLETHPFAKTGFVTIVDAKARRVFDWDQTDLGGVSLAAEAVGLLNGETRIVAAAPWPPVPIFGPMVSQCWAPMASHAPSTRRSWWRSGSATPMSPSSA
jgi:adenylate cyclase